MLTTHRVFGLRFVYDDGTVCTSGSWAVPFDSDHDRIDDVGADVGWVIVQEMAKKQTRTVTRVEVIPWPITDE